MDKNQTLILVLTGPKSHPPTQHEYIKNARLVKAMLQNASNLSAIPDVEIIEGGWPDDISIFDRADLILTFSDGSDGPGEPRVPFLRRDRIDVIKKQIDRGCGFMTFHFSTFAPDTFQTEVVEWAGGYFDWQNETGEREWYSDIRFLEEEVELNDHPVCNGIKPFRIFEEYYFDIRFQDDDSRLRPIVSVPQLNSKKELGNVVAWSVERSDGGRGFGTTMGHLYANWKNPDYRKLLLNAIWWSSGNEVPSAGVESEFYDDQEVTQLLFNRSLKALILTGNNHPMHPWKETTPLIKKALEMSGDIHVDISTNINDLGQYDLRDYSLLVFNYANWEEPDPLWDASKRAFLDYAEHGGSLMFIHFANGAFHFSLPGAGESDWPEYRRFCRRVWDHNGGSTHDSYGNFLVNIAEPDHFITRELKSFSIEDELYYNQKGEEPIKVLLSARSKDTGIEEPQAWVYEVPSVNGYPTRVFQTVLGHDTVSLSNPGMQQVLSRAANWLVEGERRWNDL